jgi:hypothetical protein
MAMESTPPRPPPPAPGLSPAPPSSTPGVLRTLFVYGPMMSEEAITALIGFAILNGLTQQIEDDINEATVRVLNLVVANRQKVNTQNLAA